MGIEAQRQPSLTRFIGRDRELAELGQLLAAGRLVTLTGAAGCGKTRLATEAMDRLAGDYPDGTWFVDLAPVREPALVAGAVIESAPPNGIRAKNLAQLTRLLSQHATLVVLDNCEHLIEGVAEVALSLVRSCGQLRILATSREALGVEGEWIMRVAPLPEVESIQLFEDRARHADAAFRLDASNTNVVRAICQRLDGLPLAIELAAASVGAMNTSLILEHLDERFRLLVGGPRSAVARHRTLRAAVEWSDALLSPPERRLFHRLGVFVDGFSLEAAEAVVADADLPASDVLPLLRRLVERSLVLPDPQGRAYRLLETLREYAFDQLAARGDGDKLRDAHLAYFKEKAWRALEALLDLRTGNVALEGGLGNFRAALEHGSATGSALFPRLAVGLMPIWRSGGPGFDEGRRWMESALAAQPTDPVVSYRLRWALGWLTTRTGDFDASRRYFKEALAVCEERSETRDAVWVLSHWAGAENAAGDPEAGLRLGEQALALARKLDSPEVLVRPLNNLAMSLLGVGDNFRAVVTAQEAVVVGRQEGSSSLDAALDTLATAHLLQGDVAAATAAERECLRLNKGDAWSLLAKLGTAAAIFVARGQPERAARLAGAVESGCERLGLDPHTVWDYNAPMIEQGLRSLGARAQGLHRAGRLMSLEDARDYALNESDPPSAQGPLLTRRELQVAWLVRQGMTDRQIAERLFISPRTAEGHVENLRNKLGINTRAEVAAWVAENLPVRTRDS